MSDETTYQITTAVIDDDMWSTICTAYELTRGNVQAMKDDPSDYGFFSCEGSRDDMVDYAMCAACDASPAIPAQAAKLLWVATNVELTPDEQRTIVKELTEVFGYNGITEQAFRVLRDDFIRRCAARTTQNSEPTAEATTS